MIADVSEHFISFFNRDYWTRVGGRAPLSLALSVDGTASAEKHPERASRLPQNKKQDKLSRENNHFLWGR
ncbi:unnamed protein product [marine sediment metagenome]|uniref:Uncharacterized protein n=1 Tax=marine sediment metagenome TaxID=412755 RepID=X1MN94_9ZZZZ